MAVSAPFIAFAVSRVESSIRGGLIFSVLIVVNELFIILLKKSTCLPVKLVEYTIGYMLSYGLIYCMGIAVNRIKKEKILVLSLVFGTVFAISMCVLNFPEISAMKYPPRIVYISYGLAISLLIVSGYNFIEGKRRQCEVIRSIVIYIAKNSLTIYYFHIFIIGLSDYGLIDLKKNNFVVRYIFVFGLSTVGAIVYGRIKIFLKYAADKMNRINKSGK